MRKRRNRREGRMKNLIVMFVKQEEAIGSERVPILQIHRHVW